MSAFLNNPQKNKTGKIFLALSICVFLFWVMGSFFGIYRFALVVAIFELLWLPMLGMLFVLPVLSFIFWAKEKFVIRSLYLYSMLIFITTILLMIFL